MEGDDALTRDNPRFDQPHPTLCVQVARADEEELKLVVGGHLKYDTVAALQAVVLDEQARVRPRRLVLDCAAISFVDSQALALLLALSKSCRRQGADFVLRNPREMLKKLILLSRLDSLFILE